MRRRGWPGDGGRGLAAAGQATAGAVRRRRATSDEVPEPAPFPHVLCRAPHLEAGASASRCGAEALCSETLGSVSLRRIAVLWLIGSASGAQARWVRWWCSGPCVGRRSRTLLRQHTKHGPFAPKCGARHRAARGSYRREGVAAGRGLPQGRGYRQGWSWVDDVTPEAHGGVVSKAGPTRLVAGQASGAGHRG